MSLLDAAGVINGDIWCNGAFDFESPLKDLLDSGDYTLEQLLAEDELLQELRAVHPQLVEFFSSEEAVAGLIQYIILPPSTKAPSTKAPLPLRRVYDDLEKSIHDEIVGPPSGKEHLTIESKIKSNRIDDTENTTVLTSKQPGKWLEGGDSPEVAHVHEKKSEQEEEDDLHIRFPYMACEVICCEIKGIIDILVDGIVPALQDDDSADDGKKEVRIRKRPSLHLISDDTRGKPILDLLFSILYKSEVGEIDDYRAGYFEKIMSILFRHRPKDIAHYLNDGGGKGDVALMSAMFKHLYSHSLMQIVQRLLLPQLPPPVKPEGGEVENKDETNECEDLFNDTMEGIDTDPIDSFRCKWSESELALQMVMDCLIGESNSEVKQEDDGDDDDDDDDDDDEEDRKLDLYQNSSEVLITIIQNSPLTSVTMRKLTTDPNLGKLISAATNAEEGSEFSRHDSRLTCAMNVLESLILQLGGYGSVGTMIYEGDGQGSYGNETEELLHGKHIPTSDSSREKSSSSTTSSTSQQNSALSIKNYATPETLIHHLPTMMSSLSNLLVYPGAEKWISPMQFSKTKEQNILGSSRLRIVRLLESLVLLGNKNIDSLLCESSCLEVCLDLFWKFQWCSMLHQSVANLLVHAFEGQNSRSELQLYFIERCNLLGRLMYSFWDKGEEGNITSIICASNVELSESIMGHKDSDSEISPTLSSVVSEKESGGGNDVLLVSDDDVDSAIEQEEDSVSIRGLKDIRHSNYLTETSNIENGSGTDNDDTITSSFRLGYMGHVIIICQALVHACIEENETTSPLLEDPNVLSGESFDQQGQLDSHFSRDSNPDSMKANEGSYLDDHTSADDTTRSTSLILARLVRKHPLGKIWHDFVLTTLASETALQTTPLGGYQATTLATDPLQMHRPGLEDNSSSDDDNGEAPVLPQRGLLVDGDVIDMDDHDLEVAANMIAGLNLAQVVGNHVDSQTQLNPSHQSGYIFDDPLGNQQFGEFDLDDDADSSSEEEVEMDESTGLGFAKEDRISNEHEAPVMDLFAGNFDVLDETDTGNQASGTWSDFANFDDAFASTNTMEDDHKNEENGNFESLFGDVKSHDLLLDDLDKPPSSDNGTLSFDNPADVDVEAKSD